MDNWKACCTGRSEASVSCAACRAFADALLAENMLALVARCVEVARAGPARVAVPPRGPHPGGFKDLPIVLPPDYWPGLAEGFPTRTKDQSVEVLH